MLRGKQHKCSIKALPDPGPVREARNLTVAFTRYRPSPIEPKEANPYRNLSGNHHITTT